MTTTMDEFRDVRIDGHRVFLPAWVSEIVGRSPDTIRQYMTPGGDNWLYLDEDEGEIIRLPMYNKTFPLITEKGIERIREYHEHGRDNGDD